MEKFEKLGAFYLGRTYDPTQNAVRNDLLLYDSKDLTTHAVCVGMTGSGKTGLCVSLLEEAALDGIPALAIDPKGDLGNLLLTFPELAPADFRPWVDPGEAARKGQTLDAYAADVARTWQRGLAEWGQDGERIARMRQAVDVGLYTPGSTAGRPLRLLESFDPPSGALLDDAEARREAAQSAISGLLSLVGVDADPLRSREHVLLSNLVERAWDQGRGLGLEGLIAGIQSPPFERLGVLELEAFFPASQRFELAMQLNSLLASPSAAAWLNGEPLDAGRLLYTPQGQPRLSVLSIAHLSERERMFFVTRLLNEVVSWMRAQPGTPSLRALLYMDEVFGYLPPTANPPSKLPLLTLLKQARAYGLGVVLATQNPVDLDYKALSNAGTWFLGRLQTERDKARVMDGLEGAAATTGAAFDRGRLDGLLSGLRSRVFLMSNVHDDGPELFHTRWAMSYLRGPLTREQIRDLAQAGRPDELAATAPAAPPPTREPLAAEETPAQEAPVAAGELAELPQGYLALTRADPGAATLVYRPALLATARLHFTDRRSELDHWQALELFAPLTGDAGSAPAELLEARPPLEPRPERKARFAPLPKGLGRRGSLNKLRRHLAGALYRGQRLILRQAPALKLYAEPGADPGAFDVRVREAAREARDRELERLRRRYTPKLATLQDRVLRAEQRVDRESAQAREAKLGTLASLGATVLGALFGRRVASVGTVGRAATTARQASRISRERDDIARAEERLEGLRERLEALEAEFEASTAEVTERFEASLADVRDLELAPRKSDIAVEALTLVWAPWWVAGDGLAERGF